ncbi:MAG: ribonuclease HI [Gammaproteobacteria bacterium]|nr:MAG: ribonuclease HI [Gammaproteobacteria bacterium]
MAANKTVIIYTDGACKGNPGVGGWGALLRYGEHEKAICGAEHDTTNNRMELTAAIKALELLTRPCQIELWTDSTYVKKGISEWIVAWKKNNWKTAAKKPVVNQDLWQRLDKLTQQHDISWHWVKGHAGHPGNEMADQLANQGIDNLTSQT